MADQTAKVDFYKRTDGLWDWRLFAANGKEVASSAGQGYTERNDAVEGWLLTLELAPAAESRRIPAPRL
jgi:uncharacterized protein YegP (UPF0339 family)